jgi:ABC-2 type transport system permease protein
VRNWFVRAFSVLVKEIHEVRRQPLLILSLIGGPFLVLALFGATFRSTKPELRTVLVLPETGIPGIQRAQLEEAVRWNFKLLSVVEDPQEALAMLEAGQVDVVQVLPRNIMEKMEGGQQASIEVYSYTVDPTAEAWIRSMMMGQVNFINRQMLLDRTGQAQKQAITVQIELTNAQGVLGQLEGSLTPQTQREAERALNTVRGVLKLFLTFLDLPLEHQGVMVPFAEEIRVHIEDFLAEVDRLDQALRLGELDAHRDQLAAIAEKIDDLQGTIGIFVNLPPEVIVSPFHADYSNQRGTAYSLMVYYTPRVLALLIQHLAITLGAFALVRERQTGAMEMFRVAPLNIAHLMLGKTLAYTIYVILASVTLGLLMQVLNVPILGSATHLLLLLLLLSLSSIGIGLLISALSSSDSQAIQMTMIVLLLSVFFTGFFLPLEGFTSIAQPISTVLPMTHGLTGLQNLMLVGQSPSAAIWWSLITIILVTYTLVLVIIPRLNRNIQI